MWQAARLFPSQPLIEKYIEGAEPDVFRDAAYFRELARSASPSMPHLTEGIDLRPRQAVVEKNIRQKLADLIRG
jgi:hypothetical protein